MWLCERSDYVTGEGAATGAVKGTGLKGCGEKLRLGVMSLGEVIGERAAQLKTAKVFWRPPRTAWVEWSQLEPRRQLCAAEGGAGEVTQAPWRSPEARE